MDNKESETPTVGFNLDMRRFALPPHLCLLHSKGGTTEEQEAIRQKYFADPKLLAAGAELSGIINAFYDPR